MGPPGQTQGGQDDASHHTQHVRMHGCICIIIGTEYLHIRNCVHCKYMYVCRVSSTSGGRKSFLPNSLINEACKPHPFF